MLFLKEFVCGLWKRFDWKKKETTLRLWVLFTWYLPFLSVFVEREGHSFSLISESFSFSFEEEEEEGKKDKRRKPFLPHCKRFDLFKSTWICVDNEFDLCLEGLLLLLVEILTYIHTFVRTIKAKESSSHRVKLKRNCN